MPEAAFRVTGRVQGVGFRWWTSEHARRLGLDGEVRNEADGSVVVEARGEAAALEELRRLLGSGPPGALVDRVADVDFQGDFLDGFRIAR